MNQEDEEFNRIERESKLRMNLIREVAKRNHAMEREHEWIVRFYEAYHNAVVYGTGFIKLSIEAPKGLVVSVVDPEDYHYIRKEKNT